MFDGLQELLIRTKNQSQKSVESKKISDKSQKSKKIKIDNLNIKISRIDNSNKSLKFLNNKILNKSIGNDKKSKTKSNSPEIYSKKKINHFENDLKNVQVLNNTKSISPNLQFKNKKNFVIVKNKV